MPFDSVARQAEVVRWQDASAAEKGAPMASRGWRGREADPAVSADTGAGRGIGRASAIELARMGADILGSGSPTR